MPRIDPLQLLKCLSVLLSPEGGILSRDEVPRLVNLMTKFSKKLVSKCVYILILKNTDANLVNLFMAEGGWALIQTWLQDAMQISNWDLVKEILSLLLVTPVDVERLKLNNIPKLVKGLSRLDDVKGVHELSQQLVHNWLMIVKSSTKVEEVKIEPVQPVIETVQVVDLTKAEEVQLVKIATIEQDALIKTVDSTQIKEDNDNHEIGTTSFYKLTIKDGKQIITKTEEGEDQVDFDQIDDDAKREERKKLSRSSSSKHGSSSSSKGSSKSSSSSSNNSNSSKDRHKSSSKNSSRDKDRDRKEKDKYKDKHKSNGSKHSSSSGSNKNKSESKEKQAEKDKDTLAKIKPQSIDKIGRIPKKSDSNDKPKDVKKPTMSIEVRKNNEERPKTVKVFNSKRRSTGLEEEARPPPPRPVKKPPPSNLPAVVPSVKRSSPTRDMPVAPPEKKIRVDIAPPERPGAIKLIPPKPKPSMLQESDIFMDALTASATTKKEPKKRKRRPSVSKETPESPNQNTPEPATPTSPLGLKNIGTLNFYQDTLDTENSGNTPTDKEDEKEDVDRVGEAVEEARTRNENGLKGVLLYTKRKGPKKSVRFNDSDLTQVRFFELDETERVNVTKTFLDMAKIEMTNEREALQMSRKLPNEDLMEPQTMWRRPFLIEQSDSLVMSGCKSLEKDIQYAREKSVLQALYFDKRKIPDSPDEPLPENHQMTDPITIPLEDAESQEMDLRNTPWPEPKGSPPPPMHDAAGGMGPQLFNNMQMPFQNFPNMPPPGAFQGMPPRFAPNQFGPNMMPNGMGGPGQNIGPPPPDMMHPGPPGPMFGPGPDNFNPMMNDNNFPPMQFNPPNMGGMFPPNNFNNRGGRGGFRRGGGGGGNNNGPWIPMNRGGSWNRGGGRGGRLCKNVKNHGFCRNMDKCPFIHPK